MMPRPPRVLRAVAAAAVFAAAIAGCAWRAETPPIERRTPTAEVVLRDRAAEREQAVVEAVGGGDLALIQAAAAPVRLAALGGVYVATPGASPSDRAPQTLAAATRDARDGALADADAADGEDGSLAALLRSIALSHAVALAAPDAAGAPPAPRLMPDAEALGDALVPAAGTSVSADVLSALAVAHDRAGFAYEVAAARAADDERDAALARARLHRDRSAALIAAPGVDDARSELYDVPAERVETADARAALERDLETALGWDYAALLEASDPRDAGWLLHASYDAYLQAASLPGFAAEDVPALPGLEVDAG